MDVLYGFGVQVYASLGVRGRWCGTSDLAIRQYGISHHISKSLCALASVSSVYLFETVWTAKQTKTDEVFMWRFVNSYLVSNENEPEYKRTFHCFSSPTVSDISLGLV